jgi:hypothetical protein
MAQDPAAWIDLDRYPITALAGARGRALVADCRAQVEATGACELPGFLRPEALARFERESAALIPRGHYAAGPATVYLDLPDMTQPEGHPRRTLGHAGVSAIAYDLVPPEHALRRLYEWDPLMDFVGAALGKPRLYRYADPFGALNVAVMKDGDELFWHFDQTDFVVSLALRDALEGGDFEYCPLIRTRDDERYPDVQRVLEGDLGPVRRLPMTPGTLLLFCGRYSMHRVTTIRGEVERLVALLAYDTRPDTVSSPLLQRVRYGRVAGEPSAA